MVLHAQIVSFEDKTNDAGERVPGNKYWPCTLGELERWTAPRRNAKNENDGKEDPSPLFQTERPDVDYEHDPSSALPYERWQPAWKEGEEHQETKEPPFAMKIARRLEPLSREDRVRTLSMLKRVKAARKVRPRLGGGLGRNQDTFTF